MTSKYFLEERQCTISDANSLPKFVPCVHRLKIRFPTEDL